MKCWVEFVDLKFIRPAGTSRGVLHTKPSWILHLNHGAITGKGEISIIPGLSPEFSDLPNFQKKIAEVMAALNGGAWDRHQGIDPSFLGSFSKFPSILFALETAWLDFKNGGRGVYFDNAFSHGAQKIPINGLIWMGSPEQMLKELNQKLKAGFTTIKMKIGAMDWEKEFALLQQLRKRFTSEQLIVRVDANGAFTPEQATMILKQLHDLGIHSIEQPIPQGNTAEMRKLCQTSTIPIALDEELIGVYSKDQKRKLLESIKPPFIVLKPSLHGGISGTNEWIQIAEKQNVKWWITSALESNIGLKAICEFTAQYINDLPQGLGTGLLYSNNFPSDLIVQKGFIHVNRMK